MVQSQVVHSLSNCHKLHRVPTQAPMTNICSLQYDHKTCDSFLHPQYIWNPQNNPEKDALFFKYLNYCLKKLSHLTLSIDITKSHLRYIKGNLIASVCYCGFNLSFGLILLKFSKGFDRGFGGGDDFLLLFLWLRMFKPSNLTNPFGCHKGNGDKLSCSQAEPGQGITSAVD